ncbi:MAG: hypothetical protein HY931_01880 [Candidatus Falkowbacteria bacterium]|nr:MAG: hypothetical protein HY931_01880 [Candidatus Falkowbacteria bacterium]
MKKSSLYTNFHANQLKMAIFLIGFLLIAIPDKTNAKLITVGTASDIVSFGNNVGVGSTAPNQKLHIFDKVSSYATINIEGPTDTADKGAAILFNEGNGATQWDGGLYGFKVAYDGGNNYLFFEGFGNGTSAGKHLNILRTGNVGIGLTNPGTKLDITGTLRNSLATTHSLLGGAGNVIIMADNDGSLFSATPTAFTASINVSTLYHIKKWFTPQTGQTISSSGTTVTMLNPVSSYQFSSSMVGSRLTINGESRVITAYTSTSVVTVDSAYSTNYSGVSDTLWGVYSKAVEIASDGSVSTYSETGSMAIRKRSGDGNVYIPALLDSTNNYYLPSSVLYLDKDFPIKWSNSTSYSASSGNDVGLRRTATGTLEVYNGTSTTPGTVADYRDLNIRSFNPAGGNIGIGTTTPSNNKLTVVSDQSGGGVIKVQNTNIASWSSYEMFDYAGVHKTSFGYANPNAPTVAGLAHFSTSDDTPFIIAIHDLEKIRFTTEGYIGVAQTNPSRPLHISSTSTDLVAAGNNNSMVMIDGLMNSTSRQQSGIVSSPYINPPSASTQTYIGLNFIPNSDSPYVSGAQIMGLYGGAYYYGTSTLGYAYGGIFKNFASDTSTITRSYGVFIDDAYRAAGAHITNNYGLWVENQTAGTNNYAIYSEGGKNYFGGNVGIGTTTPWSNLTVRGVTSAPSIVRGAASIFSVASADGVEFAFTTATSSPWTASIQVRDVPEGSGDLAYPLALNPVGGNVGIGTAAPNQKLDIAGNVHIRGAGTLYNNAGAAELHIGYGIASPGTVGSVARLALQPYGHTGGPWKFVTRDTAGAAYLDFDYSSLHALTLDSSGNVGIGTQSPNVKLYVSGQSVTFLSATSSNTMLMGRNSTENLYIYQDDTSVTFESVQDENTAGFGNMIFKVDNDGTADGYFAFQNKAATNFMRITATGSVAIGTTAPVSRLSVTTSTFLDNTHAISFGDNLNYYYGIGIAGGSGTEGVGIWGGSEGTDKSLTNPNLFVKRGGNVGIGTTAPAAKLDVAGTTKLGTAGGAFTAMGTCTIASTAISTTKTNYTCTGVPASTAVAVNCSGANTQSGAGTLYCRATGTADQVACNTSAANTTAMTWTCMWIQP